MKIEILRKSKPMQALKIFVDKGEALPLHDHPDTQVFMYVLFGKLKVDFYSYVDDEVRDKIVLRESVELTQGMHRMIMKEGLNLHHIEALESSCFMDVMAPGYFENENPPTWLKMMQKDGDIYVKEVAQPLQIAQAKEEALKAYESSLDQV